MPIEHKVEEGDCISSIAYRYGFAPETIWSDSNNDGLRSLRNNPNTLLPGADKVHVRDKEAREENAVTGKRHRFKRIGVPEMLRIRFLDEKGEPRKGIPFELQISGGPSHSGQTGVNGDVNVPVQPDAVSGVLALRPQGAPEERYELELGSLRPYDGAEGVRERLQNLGFYRDDFDMEPEILLKIAIRQFQEINGLPPTGKPDTATLEALRDYHGS